MKQNSRYSRPIYQHAGHTAFAVCAAQEQVTSIVVVSLHVQIICNYHLDSFFAKFIVFL